MPAWLIERLQHFAFYFILAALICWAAYAAFLKPVLWPNPSTTQTGGTSFNLAPKSYFGCTNWNIKGAADKSGK
jgi:hypothetical protein